jgi:hypothetical protein
MRVFVGRAGAAMLLVAAAAVLTVAWLSQRGERDEPRAASPGALAAPARSSSAGGSPSATRASPGLPQAAPATADRIEIAGSQRAAIASTELADRPTSLTARDRRAWRLSEFLPDAYSHSDSVIHALTIDGRDYILRGAGRTGDDVLVVRRASGELYLGWLDDRTGGAALGDAERPAERIERVVRITVAAAEAARAAQPPARLSVVIDGVQRQAITAASFAASARLSVAGPRDAAVEAIDVAHAFGDGLALIAIVADGTRQTIAPPTPTARAVILLTRRARFKLAWIDPAGQPIHDAQQRELSEISLRSAPRK